MKEASPKQGLASAITLGAKAQVRTTAIQAVLNLGLMTLVARAVPPAEMGRLAAATILTSFLSVVLELGIPHALVQYRNLSPSQTSAAFWLTQLFALAITAALWLGASSYEAIIGIADVAPFVKALALMSVISTLGLVPAALLERELRFADLASIQSASYVVGYGVFGPLAVYGGAGVWSLVIAFTTRAACQSILSWRQAPIRLFPIRVYGHVRPLLSYGFGLTLSRVLDFIAWQADNFVVGRTLGPASLGLYQRAYEFAELPGRFLGKVSEKVLFSGLARVQDDKTRRVAAFYSALELGWLIALPIGALFFIAAESVVLGVLGESWRPMIVPLRYFSLMIAPRTAFRLAESAIRASGKVYSNAVLKAAAAIAVTGAAVIGSASGINTVAALVCFATVSISIAMVLLALHVIGAPRMDIIRAVLPSIVVGGLVLAANVAVDHSSRHLDPGLALLPLFGLASAASWILGILLSSRLISARTREFLGQFHMPVPRPSR